MTTCNDPRVAYWERYWWVEFLADPAARLHVTLTPVRDGVASLDECTPPEALALMSILRWLRDTYHLSWYGMVAQAGPLEVHIVQAVIGDDDPSYYLPTERPTYGTVAAYVPAHADLEDPA